MNHLPSPDDTDKSDLKTKMSLLGNARTPAKAKAARENGKLGGWKKGRPLSEETRRKISETKRRQMLERIWRSE